MNSARQYFHEIMILLGKNRRKLPMMVLLFLGVSLFDLAGLGLIVPYITILMESGSVPEISAIKFLKLLNWNFERDILLYWMSGVLVAIFLLKAILIVGVNNVIIKFSQKQRIDLCTNLMHAYQHLPYQIFLQRNSSEYIHSLQELTIRFEGFLVHCLRFVSDVVVMLVILSLLLWENTLALSLLLFLLGGALILFDLLFREKMRGYGIGVNEESQKMVKGIHEGIEGLKVIRILGLEKHFHKVVHKSAENIATNNLYFQLIQIVPRYLFEVVIVLFVVSLVTISASFGTSVNTLLGTLGLFGVATIRILPMVATFSSTLNLLRFERDAIARLHADAKNLKDVPERISIRQPKESSISLRLDNVNYSYPNAKQMTIQSLNLEISAGEAIGLIGPSGSGKTTVVDVLLGLLEPQSGIMEFNGQPLQEHLGEWRSQVAYLPQQVFLIDNSLRCNVALGEEELEIDDARLLEALRQARLTELVEQLPEGVNTILGERGVRLSGGQRQRVAIARAFYHGRSVLVMDEATSALDNETEKEIVAEIERLKGQKTMIVIAHRLTTVQHCDRIYRLDKGKIVEVGTPDQILKKAS